MLVRLLQAVFGIPIALAIAARASASSTVFTATVISATVALAIAVVMVFAAMVVKRPLKSGDVVPEARVVDRRGRLRPRGA